MYLIREELPTSIKVENRDIPIFTDFKNWIKFELILTDKTLNDSFKPFYLFTQVLDIAPGEINNLSIEPTLKALFSFYRRNKAIKNIKSKSSNKNIPYRFDYDIDLIFAAFLQQYNVNIFIENMHWFEFSALFDGLSSTTKFIEVVGYRTMDISKIQSKNQREKYAELQEFYKIPEEKYEARSPWDIEAELLAKVK